jgi:hypothetical protein
MKKLFEDILSIDGVHGLILLSEEGKVLFESLDEQHFLPKKNTLRWKMIVDALEDFREMDLMYEQGRFYMLKTAAGCLIISMSLDVSTAMLKLNCDIIVPQLQKVKSGRGFKKFFGF